MKMVNRALNGLTVSSIWVDREGGTWCTTIEKGVYFSSNYSILHYSNFFDLNKKTTLLKAIGQNVFVSTEIDKLNVINNDQIVRVSLLETGNSDIMDVIRFKNNIYLASKGYISLINDRFQINKIIKADQKKSKVNITGYQLDTTKNNLFVLGVGSVLKLKDNYFELIDIVLKSKARCFKAVNDSIIYAGCNDGIYKLNLLKNVQYKIPSITTSVSKIILSSDGIIYFTTKGQGLFKLINDLAVKIDLGQNSHFLEDMIEDKNHQFWISSSDGLIKLRKAGENYIYEKYNTSNGLISNNLKQLTIVDDFLYVSSNEGIFKFPIQTSLLNKTPPSLYINEIKVNDSIIVDRSNILEFKYNENSLTVTLDRITFKQGKSESLLYKLKGQDNKFKNINTSILKFENLLPNKYELIIYAVNSDGVKSDKPLVIKFEILPPFWKTWYFIFGMLILLVIIIILIVKKTIQNIKKKEEEKTAINKLISEYQLKGLQAQMNPHFIFNAINSIQNYVLNKKEDEAYDYLAKFSKLIRMVLNNSRDNEISLHTELETLNLYIELEQLRFDNSFDYVLHVSSDIDLYEIEIPTMLIQPYVENAIWHGLMNLKGERNAMLKIDISIDQNLLKVVVEDNGIGRVKANEYKKDVIHHSIAMQLTNERIAMIEKMENTKNIKVLVIDLYDANQNASGTRIELFLPLLY